MIVIECDLLPGGFIMTGHAVRRKRIRNVVGIRNIAVIVFVASETIVRKADPLIICVAIAAKDKSMSPAQFKACILNMIKLSTLPPILIMAEVAVCRKSVSVMSRRCRLQVIIGMATIAVRSSACKFVDVAGVTVQLPVRPF